MAEENKTEEKVGATFVRALALGNMGVINYAKKNIPKPGEKPFPICTMYGTASKVIVKKDQAGDPIDGLQGDFEGVSYEDGVVYNSGVAYLPSGMQDRIVAALSGENAVSKVDFALEIAVAHATNKTGYTYVGRDLQPPSASDPLAALRTLVAGKAKLQIAAPKVAEKVKA